MQLTIIQKTTEYRGDHDAEVTIAHEYVPGETIEQLYERICGESNKIADVIEIRATRPAANL